MIAKLTTLLSQEYLITLNLFLIKKLSLIAILILDFLNQILKNNGHCPKIQNAIFAKNIHIYKFIMKGGYSAKIVI